MLNVILIDDEPKSITSLEWELNNFCKEVKIVASFTKPQEALDFLKKNEVDCIFLDIEMPEIDGFQFLEYFRKRDFEVIFVTAYDQFAINAIKENALDYLLKPIDSDDLKVTVQKIKDRMKTKTKQDSLEKSLLSISEKKVRIFADGKIIFLDPDEIIYCKSDGNYCRIFLDGKKNLFVTKKLKEVGELLPEDKFYRIHNSYIINLKKVIEYFKTDGYVVLNNQKRIPVSRNKKSSFLDQM